MTIVSSIRALFSRNHRSPRQSLHCTALALELLEDRTVPAVLTVNSLAENLIADDGLVTLREAVAAANSDGTTDLGETGGGADTIVFDSNLVARGPATIRLSRIGDSSFGPSSLLIYSDVTIVGPNGDSGITLARDASVDNLRLFHVTSAGALTFENLTLRDGRAAGGTGGTGRGGGGGGAGLGGAIFNEGSLRIRSSTLTANEAQGGSGGVGTFSNFSGIGGGPNGGFFGGSGGFGGGGAGGFANPSGTIFVGSGGFGGGGGGDVGVGIPGNAGFGAGNGGTGAHGGGGGGAGLGGAIFNRGGQVEVANSTLSANEARSGDGGGGAGQGGTGEDGSGRGGAIFNHEGVVSLNNSTVTANVALEGGGGLASPTGRVSLISTIIAGNIVEQSARTVSFAAMPDTIADRIQQEDLTVRAAERVLETVATIPPGAHATIQLGPFTITGSAGVLRSIQNGVATLEIASGEHLDFFISGSLQNISVRRVIADRDGDGEDGVALIEGFDLRGNSLGIVRTDSGDVSDLFGSRSLTRFRITNLSQDLYSVSGITFFEPRPLRVGQGFLFARGLGVSGGSRDEIADPGERVELEFSRPVTNVSFRFFGEGLELDDRGTIVIDAFDSQGAFLGSHLASGPGIRATGDVSALFNHQPISGFRVRVEASATLLIESVSFTPVVDSVDLFVPSLTAHNSVIGVNLGTSLRESRAASSQRTVDLAALESGTALQLQLDELTVQGGGRVRTFDLAALPTQTAGSLTQDQLTIGGSPGLGVLNRGGLGVVGGVSNLAVDGGEHVDFTFAQPVTDVSFSVNAFSDQDGDGDTGETLIEAFDANGLSLGTTTVVSPFTVNVSDLFGNQSISRFRLTAPSSDGIRLSSVSYRETQSLLGALNRGGLGVVGGVSNLAVDGGEHVDFTFAQPVTDVSFSVNAFSDQDGDGDTGETLIEAFDANGLSLGTTTVVSPFTVNVSDLFGNQSISRFRLTAPSSDGIRLSSVSYVPTNLVGTFNDPLDPHLGALQDNGGPTPTHELLDGSPALDAGSNSLKLTFDQRGERREQGADTDVGAFELSLAVNEPPQADPQTASTREDEDLPITLSGDDGDSDAEQTLTFTIVDGPSNGLLSDFNPATGNLTYVPNANYNGPDSLTFTVTDDDTAGGSALTSGPVTVHINVTPVNDAPTAPADSDSTANEVVEGDSTGATVGITVRSSDVDSPSVSYRLIDDVGGRFSIDASTGVVSVSDGSLLDGPATHTITVEVSDGQGGIATSSFEIVVRNVAPTITDLRSRLTNGTLTLSGSFSDPAGILDSHTVTVDFGDGTVLTLPASAVDQNADTFSATHNYTRGGIFTITVTVSDEDGGVSDSQTTTAVVTGVGLNNGVLQIIGTDGRDQIKVSKHRGRIRVQTRLHGQSKQAVDFDPAEVQLIQIFGFDGNDHINVNRRVDVSAFIDGGAGHDVLKGGRGDNVILGGAGNDWIFARSGDDLIRGGEGHDVIFAGAGHDIVLGEAGNDWIFGGRGLDLLVGGTGSDFIFGGRGLDVLIQGTTEQDNEDAALKAVLTEWTSSASYSDRAANVQSLLTTQDDDAMDHLVGASARDLFFASLGDVLLGKSSNEEVIS